MLKIISGLLGILMVTAVVGGTAYALFSSTATVNGISVSTGNASLLVNEGTTYNANLNLTGLYPGYMQGPATITLTNESTSDIDLDVTARLTSYTGNWNALKNVIEVKVDRVGEGASTGWRDLEWWNTTDRQMPGSDLPFSPTTPSEYEISVRVRTNYVGGGAVGNEIANKALNNIVFTLTGTQAP